MGYHSKLNISFSLHELADELRKNSNISSLRQIDSLNYGEGYDFKFNEIDSRIYFDEKGDQCLMIEIDIFGSVPIEKQKILLELFNKSV